MIVLGIDPGLQATGYGFIDVREHSPRLLEAGTIEPKRNDDIQDKINTIYQQLAQLLERYKPDILVLEKLYAHYKHPTTACIMGHARGVICLLCAQRHIPLMEYSVKRIRKAVTGNGNASKYQTQQMVAHLLHIDAGCLSFDASDALALSLGHAQIARRKL